MTESRITAAGQTTIPASIRRRLALKAGDKVRYFIENDRAILIPARQSVKRLRGSLPKPRRPISIEEMNKGIADAAADTMKS